MSRLRSTLPRLLGAAAALLLATGLTAGPAGSASAGTTDPMLGAPTVGSCYDLSGKQANAATVSEAPVKCRKAHTSEVFTVAQLPDGLTWQSDIGQIGATVLKTCTKALGNKVGTSPLLRIRSQYTFVWFRPVQADQDAGARWYACHAIVPEDRGLGTLPHPLPKLGKTIADKVERCVAGTRKYRTTTCADDHDWRSTHSFYVYSKLTQANLDKAAQKVCPKHVKSRRYLYSAASVTKRKFVTVCYTRTAK